MSAHRPPTTWLTMKQAADRLGYSYDHVRRLVRTKQIRHRQRARHCEVRISTAEISRFMAER